MALAQRVIAGGSIAAPTAACPSRRDAALWYWSDDGWFQTLVESVAHAQIDDLLNTGYLSEYHAVGRASRDCDGGTGFALWGSTDKSDWFRMDEPTGLNGAEVTTAAADGNGIIVAGWPHDGGSAVWLSDPDEAQPQTWWPADQPPVSDIDEPLDSLVAAGDLVVGWDEFSGVPFWFSHDAGATWVNSDFRTPYRINDIRATASADGTIMAVAEACCVEPGVTFGVALTTRDGETWQIGPAGGLEDVPEALVHSRGWWIALGTQVHLSQDGLTWLEGPALPGFDADAPLHAATDDTSLVVVGSDRTWTGRVLDVLARAGAPAAAPVRPEVGATYEFELLTHCGAQGATIDYDMRTWLPDPADVPDGELPRSYGDPDEKGTLIYVAPDRLEFTGRRGDVVRFLPTAESPGPALCA